MIGAPQQDEQQAANCGDCWKTLDNHKNHQQAPMDDNGRKASKLTSRIKSSLTRQAGSKARLNDEEEKPGRRGGGSKKEEADENKGRIQGNLISGFKVISFVYF